MSRVAYLCKRSPKEISRAKTCKEAEKEFCCEDCWLRMTDRCGGPSMVAAPGKPAIKKETREDGKKMRRNIAQRDIRELAFHGQNIRYFRPDGEKVWIAARDVLTALGWEYTKIANTKYYLRKLPDGTLETFAVMSDAARKSGHRIMGMSPEGLRQFAVLYPSESVNALVAYVELVLGNAA